MASADDLLLDRKKTANSDESGPGTGEPEVISFEGSIDGNNEHTAKDGPSEVVNLARTTDEREDPGKVHV